MDNNYLFYTIIILILTFLGILALWYQFFRSISRHINIFKNIPYLRYSFVFALCTMFFLYIFFPQKKDYDFIYWLRNHLVSTPPIPENPEITDIEGNYMGEIRWEGVNPKRYLLEIYKQNNDSIFANLINKFEPVSYRKLLVNFDKEKQNVHIEKLGSMKIKTKHYFNNTKQIILKSNKNEHNFEFYRIIK